MFRKEGNGYVISIQYGNDKVDYAWFLHENLPSAYPDKNYTRNGTGSHYLTRAADYVLTERNVRNAFADAVRLVGRNTRV
ncbi:hypothetical protein M316_0122 [Nitrincola phage 1M3-16]|uniref:hypothetical protein n=1 Tax=Nitrincola phage 1M3-16 TaxID=1472912 RepID=UPI000444A9D3|nr:hypothetical protein GJ22_gp030 [Nitrincola phage 1M3-16]AHX01187.1 hypothetical protein M316_0122 [Nitrincola phage 1M3-16]